MKKTTFTICLSFILTSVFCQIQRVDISCEGVALKAYLYEAKGEDKKPTVIWMHGTPGRKEEGKNTLALELSQNGINVIRFNYRGLWGTEGTFTVGNNLEELEAVIDHLFLSSSIESFNIDTSRIIVGGYSHGSNIALIHAVHNSRIKEFVCLGLSDISNFIREYFNPLRTDIREFTQSAKDALWGPDKLIQNFDEFIDDLLWNNYRYDFVAQAEKLIDKKLLIIVGLNDLNSPIESEFLPLYRKLIKMSHPSIHVDMTKSNHSFTDLSIEKKAKVITSWIKEN